MLHTIAALSSATGIAGVSVIRVSGEDAFAITEKVFRPMSGKPFRELPARFAAYGTLFDTDGAKIDTAVVTCFHAPASYTGENTVEISCHGSPVAVSMTLGALFAHGAKPALPGEFTKRAFVNGKLDLTQAEAVGDLLEAQNAAELRLFSNQLDGVLGKKIKAVSDEITTLLASVYAATDYPDEDMSDLSDDEIAQGIARAKTELWALADSYAAGNAVIRGIQTVIVGAPNTGKSTFFNLLAGQDRAIVTDVAGTTRDVITETVFVGDIKLNIADTAGIRDTEDTVEKIGVARSKKALSEAEFVIAVFDGADKEIDTDFIGEIGALCAEKTVFAVLNKSDIAENDTLDRIKTALEQAGFCHIFTMCAKTGEGKAAFEETLCALYGVNKSALFERAVVTNARQYAAVKTALESLENADIAIKTLTRDMAGLDLEGALGALCEADGRQVSAEIVDTIFARFCVGK